MKNLSETNFWWRRVRGGPFGSNWRFLLSKSTKTYSVGEKTISFENLVLSKLFQLIDSCWIRLGTSIFCRRRRCIRHMIIFGERFHVRCYLSISNFLKNLFFFFVWIGKNNYEKYGHMTWEEIERHVLVWEKKYLVWSEKNSNCRENLRFAKISALMAPKPEHSSLRFICITRFQSCHMYIKQLLFSSSFILKNKLTVLSSACKLTCNYLIYVHSKKKIKLKYLNYDNKHVNLHALEKTEIYYH